jgi:hypothetical protein
MENPSPWWKQARHCWLKMRMSIGFMRNSLHRFQGTELLASGPFTGEGRCGSKWRKLNKKIRLVCNECPFLKEASCDSNGSK